MESVTVRYATAGVDETVKCALSVNNDSICLCINIEHECFNLNLRLKDIDMEPFSSLLQKEKKRMKVYCRLDKGREYRGLRKFVWRDTLDVSLGGVRISFDDEAVNVLSNVLEGVSFK